MRTWESRPFQNSLEVLAQVALRTTGAQGYAFFQKSRATDSWILLAGGGAVIPAALPQARPDGSVPALVAYPLRTDGVLSASLAFALPNEAETLQAKPQLDQIAATVQRIWAAAATERYAELVDRVADLEARLMDSKIADRARGLLTNETNSDPAEAIARHVDGVLRPTQTRRILEQVLSEMEEEIEERRLVGEAKQILQALHRVSEEQAHTRLRLLSRQSRKRLKEVAQQVIEEQHLLKGKSA